MTHVCSGCLRLHLGKKQKKKTILGCGRGRFLCFEPATQKTKTSHTQHLPIKTNEYKVDTQSQQQITSRQQLLVPPCMRQGRSSLQHVSATDQRAHPSAAPTQAPTTKCFMYYFLYTTLSLYNSFIPSKSFTCFYPQITPPPPPQGVTTPCPETL